MKYLVNIEAVKSRMLSIIGDGYICEEDAESLNGLDYLDICFRKDLNADFRITVRPEDVDISLNMLQASVCVERISGAEGADSGAMLWDSLTSNLCDESELSDQIKTFELLARLCAGQSGEYDMLFIWGIKSYIDFSPAEVGIRTMNDIEVVYNMERGCFQLGFEKVFFDSETDKKAYLTELLNAMTEFMHENSLDTQRPLSLDEMEAYSLRSDFPNLETLYTYVRTVFQGYCADIMSL